jgi:hypothetical protein
VESNRKYERKLAVCIDSLVEEMSSMYCADLAESAKIDAKMSDIKLRDSLIRQISDEIRCKKISDRVKAELGREAKYGIRASISCDGLQYSVERDGNDA